MFLRPTLVPGGDGARHFIRDQQTMQHLAADGEEKPEAEYWHMRILEGGVECRGADGAWPSDVALIKAEPPAPSGDVAVGYEATLGLPAPEHEETKP